MDCPHTNVRCINHYELVRKYQCAECGEVMMCKCDELNGSRFLPHQLHVATDYVTKERLPVTLGFQPDVCVECRGLPTEPHPMAAIYGRTSKIRRYYWREIYFRTEELLAEWKCENGAVDLHGPEAREARERCGKQALDEFKLLHETRPKYEFEQSESQSDFLDRLGVDVVTLDGTYLRCTEQRRSQILDGEESVSPEEFVRRYYARLGYESLFVESCPIHVLFGTFMWLVIQDPTDERVRIVGFGERDPENAENAKLINTHLSKDFGSRDYGVRRKEAIATHFREMLDPDPDELQWLFDYWLFHSHGLRQYLWAHRDEHIEVARRLLSILPPTAILNILQYLVDSYWDRYCGWPDLLVFNESEYFFVEVKSSNDKLSDDQRRWIEGNAEHLSLPFRLAKIHKASTIDSPVPN